MILLNNFSTLPAARLGGARRVARRPRQRGHGRDQPGPAAAIFHVAAVARGRRADQDHGQGPSAWAGAGRVHVNEPGEIGCCREEQHRLLAGRQGKLPVQVQYGAVRRRRGLRVLRALRAAARSGWAATGGAKPSRGI